ncbi:hypothetical protein Tco_0401463 [Tanacetum coccineum]
MWENRSYKTHEDHKNLYEALEKSMDHDHSDQLQADLPEARKKRKKRSDSPRTPLRSPPPTPPPPPPSLGASGALGTSGALVSSQMPPPPPPPSTDTNRGNQKQGIDFTATYYLTNDDSIPDKHVHLSNDEDTGNDHLPKADLRKDWWKPLPEEERPTTLEPAWTIPSSNMSDTVLTQADFKGQAYEVVKAFYLNVIHLQFHMEEYHKMLTDQINWANPEGDQVRIDVSRPLPLSGPPGKQSRIVNFQDEGCSLS